MCFRVEILKLSPMIEIKRRTPKPSRLGFAPVLDFSDFDEMLKAEGENIQTAAAETKVDGQCQS